MNVAGNLEIHRASDHFPTSIRGSTTSRFGYSFMTQMRSKLLDWSKNVIPLDDRLQHRLGSPRGKAWGYGWWSISRQSHTGGGRQSSVCFLFFWRSAHSGWRSDMGFPPGFDRVLCRHRHKYGRRHELKADSAGAIMFRRILAAFFMLIMVLPVHAAEQLKPYRVLIVISDQWKDPRSFLVSGGGEFQTLVTMFKSWGIPFDILRLDQTLMDPSHFTDFAGKARYGAILWDVSSDVSMADQALVTHAVEKLHISLIAV